MGSVPSGFEAVDDAIRAGADGAFSFLERLECTGNGTLATCHA